MERGPGRSQPNGGKGSGWGQADSSQMKTPLVDLVIITSKYGVLRTFIYAAEYHAYAGLAEE